MVARSPDASLVPPSEHRVEVLIRYPSDGMGLIKKGPCFACHLREHQGRQIQPTLLAFVSGVTENAQVGKPLARERGCWWEFLLAETSLKSAASDADVRPSPHIKGGKAGQRSESAEAGTLNSYQECSTAARVQSATGLLLFDY